MSQATHSEQVLEAPEQVRNTIDVDVGETFTGPYLTCFDPEKSPRLAERFRSSGAFGLALPPDEIGNAAKELVRNGRCAILTHDGELSGRDLRKEVASLRGVVNSESGKHHSHPTKEEHVSKTLRPEWETPDPQRASSAAPRTPLK